MTTTATLPVISVPLVHEHAWTTISHHSTSEGVVVYVRCAACGSHRVEQHRRDGMPPSPLSRETQAASPLATSTTRSVPVTSAVTSPADAAATSA